MSRQLQEIKDRVGQMRDDADALVDICPCGQDDYKDIRPCPRCLYAVEVRVDAQGILDALDDLPHDAWMSSDC